MEKPDKRCKFSGTDCGVVHKYSERDFYKSLFRKLHPDIVICPYAYYKIFSIQPLSSIDFIQKLSRGYFATNPITGISERLTMENFEICCSKKNCNFEECPDLFTLVYE